MQRHTRTVRKEKSNPRDAGRVTSVGHMGNYVSVCYLMFLKERLTPLKKLNFSKDIFFPTPNTAKHCIFYHTRIHLNFALGDVHCKQKPCPVNADVRSLMRPCLLTTMPHKNHCKALFFFTNWLPVRRISPFRCRFLPGVVPYCLTLSEKRLSAWAGCDTTPPPFRWSFCLQVYLSFAQKRSKCWRQDFNNWFPRTKVTAEKNRWAVWRYNRGCCVMRRFHTFFWNLKRTDLQLQYTVKSAQTPEHNTLTLMYQNIKNTQKWNQYCWLFWQVSSQFLKSVCWLQGEWPCAKILGILTKVRF